MLTRKHYETQVQTSALEFANQIHMLRQSTSNVFYVRTFVARVTGTAPQHDLPPSVLNCFSAVRTVLAPSTWLFTFSFSIKAWSFESTSPDETGLSAALDFSYSSCSRSCTLSLTTSSSLSSDSVSFKLILSNCAFSSALVC